MSISKEKIKIDIIYMKRKIELQKSLIEKFQKLPLVIQEGVNKNIEGEKDFITLYKEELFIYEEKLEELYKTLNKLN